MKWLSASQPGNKTISVTTALQCLGTKVGIYNSASAEAKGKILQVCSTGSKSAVFCSLSLLFMQIKEG